MNLNKRTVNRIEMNTVMHKYIKLVKDTLTSININIIRGNISNELKKMEDLKKNITDGFIDTKELQTNVTKYKFNNK